MTPRELHVRLLSYAAMHRGWNSYDAPPPSPLAVANVERFVNESIRVDVPLAKLEPLAAGGIAAGFENRDSVVTVEFANDGRASMLLETADVFSNLIVISASPDGCRWAVRVVRDFLKNG